MTDAVEAGTTGIERVDFSELLPRNGDHRALPKIPTHEFEDELMRRRRPRGDDDEGSAA